MSKHRIRLRAQNLVAGGVAALSEEAPFSPARQQAEELFQLCGALEADANRAASAVGRAGEALAALAASAARVDAALGAPVLGSADADSKGATDALGGARGLAPTTDGAAAASSSSPEQPPSPSADRGVSPTASGQAEPGALAALAEELTRLEADLIAGVAEPCSAAKADSHNIRALSATYENRRLDAEHYEKKVTSLSLATAELANNPDPKIAVGSKAMAAKEKLANNEQKLRAARDALAVAIAEATDATNAVAIGAPKGLAACVAALLACQARLGARVSQSAGGLVHRGGWQLHVIAAAAAEGPARSAAARIMQCLEAQQEEEARSAKEFSRTMREALEGAGAASGDGGDKGAEKRVMSAERRATVAEARAEDLRAELDAARAAIQVFSEARATSSTGGSVIEFDVTEAPAAPNPFAPTYHAAGGSGGGTAIMPLPTARRTASREPPPEPGSPSAAGIAGPSPAAATAETVVPSPPQAPQPCDESPTNPFAVAAAEEAAAAAAIEAWEEKQLSSSLP